MKEVILLYSGGMDSTLLLKMALKFGMKPFCLLVSYGQVHEKELTTAVQNCIELIVDYTIIHITNLKVNSKLIDGVAAYPGVSEWHVPSRNLMFVSLAASIAESRGVDLIWYGANFADRENLFPDCYQEWVYSVNKLLKVNGSIPITLEAPLLGLSKEAILKLAEVFEVDQTKVFSGYGQ